MALAKLNPLNKAKAALEKLYADHEEAQAERAALHVKHAKIFDRERLLSSTIAKIQDTIKNAVRAFYVGKDRGQYEDFRGELFTVKVTAKYHVEYDVDGLLAELPTLRSIPGVVVESIDRAKIKALIDLGQIDEKIVAKYRTEEQDTSAVAFTPTDPTK